MEKNHSNLQGKYLRLTKLSADNDNSRNNLQIQVGNNYDIQGYCRHGVLVDKALLLYCHPIKGARADSWTSSVIHFDIEKQIIKTRNSTYSYQIVETNVQKDSSSTAN